MHRTFWTLAVLLSFLPVARAEEAAPSEPSEPETLVEALRRGQAKVSLRYRFEDVRQEGFVKDAHASTLRTTLGYSTAPYKGLSFEVEAENVSDIGHDLYDNRGAGGRSNGVGDRPVVADVALTEVNQAFLRFRRGGSELTVGRREIVLADVRLIGNVGWRQNHQSFDALVLSEDSLDGLAFEYGYLDEVHRIFGDSQPMSSHYLNVGIEAGGAGKLRLYGLLLDYDRARDSGRSSRTFGAELTGRRAFASGRELFYELEVAGQRDAGGNPGRIDARYLHAALGVKRTRLTVQLGWEVLGGSPQDGQFNTPLATLHVWNGWADQFLSTPANGLEDLYLQVSGKPWERVSWLARFHDFRAETGSAGYGRELDLELRYKAPEGPLFAVTAALYDAEAFSADTEKLMFWTVYGF